MTPENCRELYEEKILVLGLLITRTAYASETDYRANIKAAITKYNEESDTTRREQIGKMLEWLSRRNPNNRHEVPPPNILDIGKNLGIASNEKFAHEVLALTPLLERFTIGNHSVDYTYFLL